MILRFGLENHYSIRDYQEVSMVASSLKDSEEGLLSFGADSDRTLGRAVPVTVIYGANASGKSSLLSGLGFIARAIRDSHTATSESEGTPYIPFALSPEFLSRPSKFDIDFVIEDIRYHYGFNLDGKRILSEWLYSYPLSGQRQTRTVLYHRDESEDEPFYFGKSLRGENKAISKLVRPNSLYLSAAAQNAHPALTSIFEYFSEKFSKEVARESGNLAGQISDYIGADKGRKSDVVRFLKAADVGICDIHIERKPLDGDQEKFREEFMNFLGNYMPNVTMGEPPREITEVKFLHAGSKGANYPIGLNAESTGTRTLLTLLGSVLEKLRDGGVLVIDELDSSLHPLLSRKLIELFSSPTSNPGKAQLIFSTHDTNLLSGRLLRRDQIVLTEKDAEGATHVYTLSDLKVRASENIESGYLSGRYGAIPFLGFEQYVKEESELGRSNAP